MQTKQLSLSTARWIAIAIYFSGLVVYPIIGAMVKATPTLPVEAMRMLPLVLLGAATVGYVLSLIFEGMILAHAKKANNPSGAANAVIVSAAFGETLAIGGLVLTLLGAGSWGIVLYALCFIHGVHLAIRWPKFEEVAGGES
jgi:hypothetical protein